MFSHSKGCESWSGPGCDGIDVGTAEEEAELDDLASELAWGSFAPLQRDVASIGVADDAFLGLEARNDLSLFVEHRHHHIGLVLCERAFGAGVAAFNSRSAAGIGNGFVENSPLARALT